MKTIHHRLAKNVLIDPDAVVIDLHRSHGSWLVDTHGKERLDCYSQFASQPLGWNHPKVKNERYRIFQVAEHNPANSDMLTEQYADFVEAFSNITPDFNYHFFIAGGALGVENALKAAFDWKCQRLGLIEHECHDKLSVIHFKEAFHGRTGYTMSLTNTDVNKTKWFPKFEWPRIVNPKIGPNVEALEKQAISDMEFYLTCQAKLGHPESGVAAIIIEPIQGEGGDNHFRAEFFKELRRLADDYHAMLIFDEVQTGVGLTGRMWAYEHFGVKPDMICFGKKTQVCGFCSNQRINSAQEHVFNVPSRINSTWGGNLTDMVRFTVYAEIIKEENLIQNAAEVGEYFQEQLSHLGLNNVRGRGLMIAFDLDSYDQRNNFIKRLHDNMLVLKSGQRSVRLRPHLTFSKSDADLACHFIKKAYE